MSNNNDELAFITAKPIEDLPLSTLPNLVGNFVIEENGVAKRLPAEVLNNILNSGVSGDLDVVTSEQIPTTGYYKYDIFNKYCIYHFHNLH